MNSSIDALTIARRMKKLCESDDNFTETAAFIEDAITLMDLVLEGDTEQTNK